MPRQPSGRHASRRHPAHSPEGRRRTRLTRSVAVLLVTGALVAAGAAQYTVQRGDTLSAIAARFGTSVRQLAETNGVTDPNLIFAGTTLRISGTSAATSASGGASTTSTPAVQPSRPAPAQSSARTHAVARGETLTSIARRYGVTIRSLVETNNLRNPDRIVAGSSLRVGATPAGDGQSSAGPSAETASAAGAPRASLSRGEVGALIEDVATAHGWSPAFVKALAWQESGWNNAAVSHAGAIGIMQVMPGTGRFVSRTLAGRDLDLHDPEDNVLAGVLFLDYLHRLTGGDVERTLAGYYQGLGSVARNGMYTSTQRYVANVLALRERFR